MWRGLWMTILLLGLAACNQRIATEEVTRDGLEVITIEGSTTPAPDEPTPPPEPSLTSTPQQCPNAPPLRLIVQERGRVIPDNEHLNLREGPGLDYEALQRIRPGEDFFVLDGPVCDGTYAWYEVEYRGQRGWVAEGDLDEYYAEPYLPG